MNDLKNSVGSVWKEKEQLYIIPSLYAYISWNIDILKIPNLLSKYASDLMNVFYKEWICWLTLQVLYEKRINKHILHLLYMHIST